MSTRSEKHRSRLFRDNIPVEGAHDHERIAQPIGRCLILMGSHWDVKQSTERKSLAYWELA